MRHYHQCLLFSTEVPQLPFGKVSKIIITLTGSLFFFFVFCPFSRATPTAYGGSQARGSNRSYSCRWTPEPQQHQIQASATYTTAHGNAGSLTCWVRPGIEPATSWFLVGFVSTMPPRELHNWQSFFLKGPHNVDSLKDSICRAQLLIYLLP